MPKVSVIIPAYNRAYIINDAIQSALSQSFSDLEVLVVDDGSTDDTRSIVESINDTRIRYYYKSNGGVSSARNLGMTKARGRFVAFLDTDDFWPDNFLERLLESLQLSPKYGLAYCATTELYPDGRKVAPKHIERCVSGKITKELFKNSFIWPMAVLIQKDILENFCFDENLKTSDDNDAFLRLSIKTQFIFTPDIEVVRRCSSDSHARKGVIENSCNRALSLERFLFLLDGDKYIPVSVARKKISRVYKRAARRNKKVSNRKAAICLYKRAISYCCYDIQLYFGLIAALLISKNRDNAPDWKMPAALGKPGLD